MNNKELILQTALRLFGEQGYDRTPTSLIARTAGVSEGLIFRHFGNKAGLLEAMIAEGLAQIAATMEPYTSLANDPREAILEHIERALSTIRTEEKFWRLVTKIRFQSEVSAVAGEKIRAVNQFVVARLTDNFRRLGVPDPEHEALLLFAVIDGICLHWLQDSQYPLESIKNQLLKKYSQTT